ncbi:MAG: ribosome-associated translation inhibitor RaiA [Planctomycetaceae bacterium]|nr:ribosome-associated translation inhibitor RaiA [Planctomycetaceae bacterium]
MQVEFACKHGTVSPQLREQLAKKAEKLLNFHDRITAITVTIDFHKEDGHERAKVEILVDAEHKHNFVAQDTQDDVHAAFDLAMHKMEQQIRKYNEKIQDHRRTPPTQAAVEKLNGGGEE